MTLLVLSIVVFNEAAAQRAVYTTNSGMSLGFGLGAAYQQSDIANSRGAGFDFFLGSQLYKKENAFLSIDWKFRILAGENKAYDHRINTDGTYSNIRYDFYNYDLELGLTLNRLRERTRIVLSGFAGIGITNGIISTDQLDANGNPYDYSAIDPHIGRKQIYEDLLNLSDKEFEAKLINKTAVMPTLGLYLGYQFSRSFSLGIEHKINFSLTENNSSTGIDIDNKIVTGSKIDMNHYTSLGFKWILGGRASRSARMNTGTVVYIPATTNNYNTDKPDTHLNPVISVSPPAVEIISPPGNPYSTTTGSLDIIARVMNVKGRQDIRVVLNEKNIAFEYNPSYGNISSGLALTEGRNILVITVSNEAGSARDELIISWNEPVQGALPVVKFIDPASPVTVEKNIYPIRVQTRNVKAWQDVTVTVNGANTNNFNFSPDGLVTTNISLNEGVNGVNVSAKNESGSASDLTTITFKKPVKADPPVINMMIPGASPFNTYEPVQEIRARITGVKGIENISLSLNGNTISDFAFDSTSLLLNATVNLNQGNNTLIITARNDAGQDVKSYVIIREIRPCPIPVLKIIEPAQQELSTGTPSCTIRTGISNITGRDRISVLLNDRIITNYDYTGNEITFTASLNEGSNSCIIAATNTCGTQKITYSIFYKPAEAAVEKPCGIRINPGNSSWEFCLVTPSGIIKRNELTNPDFRYSGPAGSLYFLPVAGGGDAVVKGKPYTIQPGQYYLFTGNLTVTVSTKNPGSMGQWSVCVITDREPMHGNGNNRPLSPCEEQVEERKQKEDRESKNGR